MILYNLAMSHPILATKLWLPTPLANLTPRPRLIERLNNGLDRKLTLISAPAGFGKTTLLAEWIHQKAEGRGQKEEDFAFAWLSLDENDNDPTLFMSYLVAALQTVDKGLGEAAVSLLQSPNPPTPQYILGGLINELAGREARLVLTLDDYHVIDNKVLHEAITYLLDHQPPQLHLVITSRADPPLPLSRLRVRQQMNEIRAADLRFTADEAAAFLQQAWGLNLAPDDVAALEKRTEGWIAGLQLAALSMQPLANEAARADFVASFTGSHRYVLDYLMDEVLQKQPPQIQDFLLRSAILERLSAPLCQAVLPIDDAQAILEQLEVANLFLTPLDEQREWYRYHQLFADLLRHRLKQTYPDQITALYQRASRWHEAQDLTGDAIRYALAAGDTERAGTLIEKARWLMRNRGEIATLRRWLDLLPPEQVDNSAPLAISRAWTFLMAGQMGEAEAYLQRVLPHLPLPPTADTDWPAELAIMRGQIALNNRRFAEAITITIEARDKIPADQPRFRGALANILGHAYQLQGDLAAAEDAYTTAATIATQTNNRFSRLSALAAQAKLHETRGRLRQAEKMWQAVHPLAHDERKRPLPIIGLVQAGLSRIYYEWNRLDEAAALGKTAVQWGQQSGLGPVLLNGALALSQVRQAQGDYEGAQAVLHQAGETLLQSQLALLDLRLGTATARIWLQQGDMSRAAAWAEQFVAEYGLEPAVDPGDWFESEYGLLARIWLRQERLPETADLLAQLLLGAEKGGRIGQVIEALALEALVQKAQGETDQAIDTLSGALTLAEPERYVRLFVNEGRPLGELLARVIVTETAVSDYATRLLAAFEAESVAGNRYSVSRERYSVAGGERRVQEEAETAVAPEVDITQWLVEPLSERELQALQLVAEGLTNRQIGERLHIATATVKKHMENIYGKLYVRNRTQAAARARELGLL